MKPDTILFVLSEIAKEMQIADLDRQLYLFERREINLKRLNEMEDKYQKLFTHMNKNHDLILVCSELDEIIEIVRKIIEDELKKQEGE